MGGYHEMYWIQLKEETERAEDERNKYRDTEREKAGDSLHLNIPWLYST